MCKNKKCRVSHLGCCTTLQNCGFLIRSWRKIFGFLRRNMHKRVVLVIFWKSFFHFKCEVGHRTRAQVGSCSSHGAPPNSQSPNGNTEATKCDRLQQYRASQGASLAHSVTVCQTEQFSLNWSKPGACFIFSEAAGLDSYSPQGSNILSCKVR